MRRNAHHDLDTVDLTTATPSGRLATPHSLDLVSSQSLVFPSLCRWSANLLRSYNQSILGKSFKDLNQLRLVTSQMECFGERVPAGVMKQEDATEIVGW